MFKESKQPQDSNDKQRAGPTAANETNPKRLAQVNANTEASKLTAQMTRTY